MTPPPALLAELEAHAASPVPPTATRPGPLLERIRRRVGEGPVPLRLAEACARAVEAACGDAEDLADLLDVHRRALSDSERRAAAIRSGEARRRCSCADGGLAGDGQRCGRCWGARR